MTYDYVKIQTFYAKYIFVGVSIVHTHMGKPAI